MDKEQFWQIIDSARSTAGHWKKMADPLIETLSKLDAPDILHWHQIFNAYQEFSYKEKLWAAAAVMLGGCSDDSFDYFRGWLTAQGKDVFMRALADPDSLAGVEAVQAFAREVCASEYTPLKGYREAARFEKILSAADYAHENRTGHDNFYEEFPKYPLSDLEKQEISGEITYAADIDAKWGGHDVEWLVIDQELKRLLPRLHREFNAPVLEKKQPEKPSVLAKIQEAKKNPPQAASPQKKRDKSGPEH